MTRGTLKETEPLEQKPPIGETEQPERDKAFLYGRRHDHLSRSRFLGSRHGTRRTSGLQQQSNEAAQMVVTVIHPAKAATIIPLQLPGQTRAYIEAPIFAQTSGYLKKWYFDIGAKVKAGDVLAEIDTPAGRPTVQSGPGTAQGRRVCSRPRRIHFQARSGSFNRKVIAAQDFDTASDTYRQSQATVIADQASLNALKRLRISKLSKRPFDGIVTERDTDIGAFVPSGIRGATLQDGADLAAPGLHQCAANICAFVRPGVEAELTLNELPGRKFPAHVTNTAGAIDPASRTLLTELEVPNESEELLPGAYAQINLKLEGDTGLVTVPSNTLLFRSEGAERRSGPTGRESRDQESRH